MSQKNWVLPNWAFGDPAASWEEILILFVANLQMLNSVKLSFFRHPLEYKNIQFFSSNIFPPEIYDAKSINCQDEKITKKIWNTKIYNFPNQMFTHLKYMAQNQSVAKMKK